MKMSDNERFELKSEHLKLIQRMYVTSHGDGSPCIDDYRPYGNSDVVGDIIDVLGWEPVLTKGSKRIFSDEQERYAVQLHMETVTALQIILYTQSFIPGVYEKDGSYEIRRWNLVHKGPEDCTVRR
jgi:hypothetical protein